jgi:hypothetical protein
MHRRWHPALPNHEFLACGEIERYLGHRCVGVFLAGICLGNLPAIAKKD